MTDAMIKRLREPLTGVLNLVTVTRKSTGEEIEKYDPLYREAADALEAEHLKRQQAEHERDSILEDLAGVQSRLDRAEDLLREIRPQVDIVRGSWFDRTDAFLAIAQEQKK